MGLTSILRGFAAMLLIIGVAMIPPMLVALGGAEDSAGAYLFAIVAAFIAGGGAYAASLGRTAPADFRGALIIILLWWAVVPLFAAIPFAAGPLTFAEAYYEAVTALTTTGGWLSHAGAVESPAGALWRAELQWLGGLASLAIAAAIFIRPAFIGIDTLLPPFPRGEKASYSRPLRNAVTAFFSVYAFLTFFAFAALAIAGAPTFDAVVMALSVVASGGFVPAPGGVEAYAPAVALILFPFIVLSGANFVPIARVLRGAGAKGRLRDVETGAYLGILLVVCGLYWILAGAHGADQVFAQLFNTASVLSTNGYLIGDAPPLIIVLVTAIIGGAAVSTAGGFKILRWLVILGRAREEIRRLITPNGVFGRRRVANEFGVWMHFIVFTMTLAILVVALSVAGHSFELAVTTATAALSNTGPLIRLAEGGAEGYAVFSEPVRWLLLVGMILGRLEGAAALALFNRAFWRA